MNMILIIAMVAMVAAAITNIILTESKQYCNMTNKAAYKEMTMAGTVLMFLSWIITSQNGAFDAKWMHIIAIIYAGIFFFDVIETFRLTERRDSEQRVICADTKKSAVKIAILYFVSSYLMV